LGESANFYNFPQLLIPDSKRLLAANRCCWLGGSCPKYTETRCV